MINKNRIYLILQIKKIKQIKITPVLLIVYIIFHFSKSHTKNVLKGENNKISFSVNK